MNRHATSYLGRSTKSVLIRGNNQAPAAPVNLLTCYLFFIPVPTALQIFKSSILNFKLSLGYAIIYKYIHENLK